MTHCESFVAASSVDERWKENIFLGLPPVPSQQVIAAGKQVQSTIACTLLIPNNLLYKWHVIKARPNDLVNKVNAHIIGGSLALDIQNQRLKENLKKLVDKTGAKVNSMKKESDKQKWLQSHTIITVDMNEIIQVLKLQNIRARAGHAPPGNEEEIAASPLLLKKEVSHKDTQTDYEGVPLSETLKDMYKELAQADKREKMLRKKNKSLEQEITKLKQQLKNVKEPTSNLDPIEMALDILRSRDVVTEIGPQTKPMKLKKIKAMISENTAFLQSYGLELRKVEFATVPSGNYLAMNWEEGEAARIIKEKIESVRDETENNRAGPKMINGIPFRSRATPGAARPTGTITKEVEPVEELKAGEVQLQDLGKTVDFGFSAAFKFDSLSDDKKQQVFELLNILDKYGITGECYHDLVMTEVGKLLPKSYLLKQAYTDLNERFRLNSTPGPNQGAQQSFRGVLTEEIKEYLNENPACKKVQVKLVGYGTPVSRSTHIVLLGFTLIDRVRHTISSASELACSPRTSRGSLKSADPYTLSKTWFRTVAGYNGPESYQSIKDEFQALIDDVNAIIQKGSMPVAGREIAVEFFLSGDYKFLTSVLGMKTSDNYCVYCKMSKDQRHDATKPRTHYIVSARKRTLEEARELSKTNKFGSKNAPLFNIEFDHVIVDDFCILSQVMDILIDNVINDCISLDEESKESDSEEHTKNLVEAIHKCGVGFFQIWKANDKWQWTTPLAATQKRILLDKLPEKLGKVLRAKTGTKVAKLWKDFKIIMDWLTQEKITGEELFNKAQKWLQEFVALGKNPKLEGYEPERVTMYMHMLPYHLPAFKDTYKNLRPYTGHGVEVSNNSVKMSFFRRGNRTNPIIDMIQWENRQWLTEVLSGRKKIQQKREAATAFGSPFTPPKRPRVVVHPSDVLQLKKEEKAATGRAGEEQVMEVVGEEEVPQPTDSSTPQAVPQPGPSRPRQPIRPQRQPGMRAVITPSSAGEKPWIKVDNPEDNDAKKVKLFKDVGAPDSDDESAPLQASNQVMEFSHIEGQGEDGQDGSMGPVVEAMNAVLFPAENNGMSHSETEPEILAPPTDVSQVIIVQEEPPTLTPENVPPTLTPEDVPPIEIIPENANAQPPVVTPAVEVVETPMEAEEMVPEEITIETHVEQMVETEAEYVKSESQDSGMQDDNQEGTGDEEDKQKSPGRAALDPKAIVSGLKKRFARK